MSALASLQMYKSDESCNSDNDSSPKKISKKSQSVYKEVNLIPSMNKSMAEEDSPSLSNLVHKMSSDKKVGAKRSGNNIEKETKSPNPCTEENFTPSLKRTYSMTEDDSPILNKHVFKRSSDNSGAEWLSENSEGASYLNEKRRSLPTATSSTISQYTSDTPKRCVLFDYNSRRRSFPQKLTPDSSKRYFHSNITTDQTPYSPLNSYQNRKRFRSNLPYYKTEDLMSFKSDFGFIDSHCHLDFIFQRQYYNGTFKEYQEKHKDTFPKCFKGCLAIFCNPYSFSKKHMWTKFLEEENVWGSFGCHPHNAKDYNDEIENSLRTALEHPKVRALGEIGLDYSTRNNCMRNLQHEAFERQLKIALERKLPLVIHCREAHDDGMAIMKKIVPKDYLIHLHCFTDTWEIANLWLQEFPNLYIGITNVVTFPSAETVHEVAKNIPLDRLLLETDAPYFVPKPLQRQNPDTRFSHPGMGIHVAAQIAALKEETSLEDVLCQTRKNTKRIYKI